MLVCAILLCYTAYSLGNSLIIDFHFFCFDFQLKLFGIMYLRNMGIVTGAGK